VEITADISLLDKAREPHLRGKRQFVTALAEFWGDPGEPEGMVNLGLSLGSRRLC
jgi:hypothetical protein